VVEQDDDNVVEVLGEVVEELEVVLRLVLRLLRLLHLLHLLHRIMRLLLPTVLKILQLHEHDDN
jgi:hypothetical protein